MLVEAIINSEDPIRGILMDIKELLDLDGITFFQLCCKVTDALNQRCRLSHSDEMEDKLRTARNVRDEASKEV